MKTYLVRTGASSLSNVQRVRADSFSVDEDGRLWFWDVDTNETHVWNAGMWASVELADPESEPAA